MKLLSFTIKTSINGHNLHIRSKNIQHKIRYFRSLEYSFCIKLIQQQYIKLYLLSHFLTISQYISVYHNVVESCKTFFFFFFANCNNSFFTTFFFFCVNTWLLLKIGTVFRLPFKTAGEMLVFLPYMITHQDLNYSTQTTK